MATGMIARAQTRESHKVRATDVSAKSEKQREANYKLTLQAAADAKVGKTKRMTVDEMMAIIDEAQREDEGN